MLWNALLIVEMISIVSVIVFVTRPNVSRVSDMSFIVLGPSYCEFKIVHVKVVVPMAVMTATTPFASVK